MAQEIDYSRQFVSNAESLYDSLSSALDRYILRNAIRRAKDGQLVLEQDTDVVDYLQAARLNYKPKVRVGNEEFTLDELDQNMKEIVKVIDQPGSTPAGIINAYSPLPGR